MVEARLYYTGPFVLFGRHQDGALTGVVKEEPPVGQLAAATQKVPHRPLEPADEPLPPAHRARPSKLVLELAIAPDPHG